MRQLTYASLIELDGKQLPINASLGRGCYIEILKALYREMKALLAHHSKVLFFRIDIRLLTYTTNNTIISKLLRQLKKWIKRKYKTKRIGHLWVRELEKAEHQHYHLIVMVDGNQVRHPRRIIERIEELAYLNDLPKPFTPKHCYYLLNRYDESIFNEAFKRGSYLAKERSKGSKGKTANNYSASRIK